MRSQPTARTVRINDHKLDEVRMPMRPSSPNTTSHLLYPKGQFDCTGEAHTIHLSIPANLAVELYRSGILPQNAATPVELSVDGLFKGLCTVTDVRYPSGSDSLSGKVTFTFSPEPALGTQIARPRRPAVERGSFILDFTHYLDDTGDLIVDPQPAHKLAVFLARIIKMVSNPTPVTTAGVRCVTKRGCRSTVRAERLPGKSDIHWHCPACGHVGCIRNWQNTRWDRQFDER